MLTYLNRDNNLKRFKAQKYYLLKGIIRNYNVIIDEKNFDDQPIDSDIKRYKEIKNLTTLCLLDYHCIKNHYRLIAVDLSQQKELDADPK